MAAISQKTFIFESTFVNVIYFIFIWILPKYIPKGPVINMPALFQMMAGLKNDTRWKSLSLKLKNKTRMLSRDFHPLLCPCIS